MSLVRKVLERSKSVNEAISTAQRDDIDRGTDEFGNRNRTDIPDGQFLFDMLSKNLGVDKKEALKLTYHLVSKFSTWNVKSWFRELDQTLQDAASDRASHRQATLIHNAMVTKMGYYGNN